MVAGLALVAAVPGENKKPIETLGTIERLKPAFDKLIPQGGCPGKAAGGYVWTEGPVWVNKDGGYLLFSDIPNNRVVKWQEGKGTSVFLKPSGYNGNAHRPEGARLQRPAARPRGPA